MLYVAQTALELGFQYALVAMALFLSYRVLDIADLTTDGCFVLGCAVSVTLTAAGHPSWPSPPPCWPGPAPGLSPPSSRPSWGALHPGGHRDQHGAVYRKPHGHGLEGQPVPAQAGYHLHPLPRHRHRRRLEPHPPLRGITVLAGVLLVAFLGTRLGLSIRATGDNRDMVRSSSINPNFTITIGLCVANALTGLSGAVVGQAQKTADINSGTGIVVIGLACLIIGETIVGRGHVPGSHCGSGGQHPLPSRLRSGALHQGGASGLPQAGDRLGGGPGHRGPSIRQWWAFQTRKRRALAGRKGRSKCWN